MSVMACSDNLPYILTRLGQSRSLSQHRFGLRFKLGNSLRVGLLQSGVALDGKFEIGSLWRRSGVGAESSGGHTQHVGGAGGHGHAGVGADPGVAGDIDQGQLASHNLQYCQQ